MKTVTGQNHDRNVVNVDPLYSPRITAMTFDHRDADRFSEPLRTLRPEAEGAP